MPTSLARAGAGAVYLHAHHPDILRFLDTKRENADEKSGSKRSLGVVIPDITFRLAKENAQMALFRPMTYNDATANRLAISPLANGTMN